MHNKTYLHWFFATVICFLSISVSAATIDKQPKNLSKKAGQYAQFSTLVSGKNLRLQWFKDGKKIAGATRRTLVLSKVRIANAGTYYLRAADAQSTVYSRRVNLSVNGITTAPPAVASISKHPVSVTKKVGQYAQFTVSLSNVVRPKFQWFLNGQALQGANKRLLSIPWVTGKSAGAYSVTVSHADGKLRSKVAALKVKGVSGSPNPNPGSEEENPAPPSGSVGDTGPVIQLNPSSEAVIQGESVTLNVGATGTGTLKYSWRKDGKIIYTSGLPSYTITAMSLSDLGAYDVVVSDQSGSSTSSKAILSLQDDRQVTLAWLPPDQRVDGSALPASEIKGYRVYHIGSDKKDYVHDVEGGATEFTINDLGKGVHYFSMTSIDNRGRESDPSEMVNKTIR
ncbi:MAG: immunoglobulin domain-containing protein [Hahellaceae bacterium]|jgi:hypothetical protein|nr:immunoglobulin domain-containing protein [Hahellaceae bacterium]